MKTPRLLSGLLIALFLAVPSLAQRRPDVSAADQKSIDATLSDFSTTLQKMDFDTFGTLFTDDCDFVNIVGMHWHGKADVVKAHSVVFTTRYRGVAARFTDRSIAQLAPGVALVVGTILMDDYTAQDGKRMTDNQFRMTLVLEKHAGHWLIRSAENTVIDLQAAKHDPIQHP